MQIDALITRAEACLATLKGIPAAVARISAEALQPAPAAAWPPAFEEPVIIAPPATPPAAPAPAPAPADKLELDDLVDLALIMRELWLDDAGFANSGDRARSMVLAVLLRLFPERAEPSVAECLGRPCPEGRCADCPADAKTPAKWLADFLAPLPRPTVKFRVGVAEAPRLLLELRTAVIEHELQARGL